jgi:hypothetical protein
MHGGRSWPCSQTLQPHKMGLNRAPDPKWPGPGIGYKDSYGEMTHREWYAEWLRCMSRPIVAAVGLAAR